MNYRIVPLVKKKQREWDRFCSESDDSWFWHTYDWIEYTISYKPELQTKNLSFLVYKQNDIQAIVPLTLEHHRTADGTEHLEFTFGEAAIPAPALANNIYKLVHDRSERDIIHEVIFREVDRLAKYHKVVRSVFRLTPLSPALIQRQISYNYLMRYGFLDISLHTQVIDLTKSEEELWRGLRRNHKRNIHKGRIFKIHIYTSRTITREIFNMYRNIHKKAAGRQTRPHRTFELMYEWLTRDMAFLVTVEHTSGIIGFEYYSVYKNCAYGFSAANDPAWEHMPVRHVLEWEAIVWMKKQGFSLYEIGLQQFDLLPHNLPDVKQLNISHFKKGFGGYTVPMFVGEKYYSKEYFLHMYRERMKKYAALQWQKKNNDEDKE